MFDPRNEIRVPEEPLKRHPSHTQTDYLCFTREPVVLPFEKQAHLDNLYSVFETKWTPNCCACFSRLVVTVTPAAGVDRSAIASPWRHECKLYSFALPRRLCLTLYWETNHFPRHPMPYLQLQVLHTAGTLLPSRHYHDAAHFVTSY